MQPELELELGAEPDAASRARRHAAAVLQDEPGDTVADAQLILTELVTNAQLHGAPPIRVRTRREDDRVRVEVEDSGRRMLVLPRRSVDAMTGRGLSLVAALSDVWGVTQAAGGGKVVWAELGAPRAQHAGGGHAGEELDLDELLAAWTDDEQTSEPHFTVRLGSVPTDLLLDAKRHIDNVVRELTLERAAVRDRPLPEGYEALIETVTGGFATARADIKRQAIAAAARGDADTELVLTLPASAADAGERYLAALDEADGHARAARLLTLETPVLHRVFRRWYVQTLVDELRILSRGGTSRGAPTFVQVLGQEVTTLSALRQTADRLTLLQKVNAELTGARTAADVGEVVFRNATEALGALSARTYVTDGGYLRCLGGSTRAQEWLPGYDDIRLTEDLPGPVAVRTGDTVVLRNLAQLAERFPALAGLYPTERVLHVAPLVVGPQRLGVIGLTFPATGELDEDRRTSFVRALADATAQALARVDADDRLAYLAESSIVLSASLDFAQTVDAVTRLFVPRLADWCSLQLVEQGRLVTVGLLHPDPEKVVWARQISERYPVDQDAPTGGPNVVRTGVSELYPEIADELLVAGAQDEEHLALIRAVGFSSAMTVPLPGRDGVLGAITLVHADSGRHYAKEDVPYVEDVARRAALAIETARVLREQSGRLADVSRVAEAAQRAILAPPPPRLGPVALAARYVSAAAEALVGGDLYETVARPGAVRLLIGDVRGKGLAAVRTATVVLGEFRSAAADLDDLAAVARQIDRRVRDYVGDEDFVTALMLEVRDDGAYVIASCGHPPALLAHDGVLSLLEGPASLPLGLGADPVVTTGVLQPGDRVLLYTDGVIEARDPERRFVDLLAVARPLGVGPLDEALDQVLDALRAAVGSALGDDLAMLAAEYVGHG